MNIALVTFYRLGEAGGVSTIVFCLQQSLEERGHPTLIIEQGDADRIGLIPGTTHPARFAINLRRLRTQRGVTRKAFVFLYVYLPWTLYGLWLFLRQNKIDVV